MELRPADRVAILLRVFRAVQPGNAAHHRAGGVRDGGCARSIFSWPLRPIISWVATHIFRIKTTLVFTGSGSGDKTVDWVLLFCMFAAAVVATCVWSALDRKRANYITLHKWFYLFIRSGLAGQMLSYGFAKAIPMQMPFPYLSKLVEPYGNLSPMGVLWSSIGAFTSYEIFAGCAEILGGLLLIFPRTLFSALVCLADMTEVFMLNMTYDVPVKLLSFHLILLSLFLLGPEIKRLVNFFFLERTTEPSSQPKLFAMPRANRIAFAAQMLVGLWLLGTNVYGARRDWRQFAGGSPKSELYGIWDVEQVSVDGEVRPPLLTDKERWKRAIFDFPGFASSQSMNDTFSGYYRAAIDAGKKSLVLTKNADQNWTANFTFERQGVDEMALDGTMNNHKVQMHLRLVDRSKFLLVSRGFHWMQEYPLNR